MRCILSRGVLVPPRSIPMVPSMGRLLSQPLFEMHGEVGSQRVTELLQLRAFRLGLLQDRNVWVGVFPECQKILVGSAALSTVALHRVSAAKLEMGQRPDGFVEDNPAMVEDFLKL